jgi:hypothetical protein
MYITYKDNIVKRQKDIDTTPADILEALFQRKPIEEKPHFEMPQLFINRTREIADNHARQIFHNYFPDEFLIPRIHFLEGQEPKKLYRDFTVPKKSNPRKRRAISEPCPELKIQQKEFALFLENTMHVLAHHAAHAYVRDRSNVTAVKVHQDNESKWSLKLDISDFFPSYNLDAIVRGLKKVYPFGVIFQDPSQRGNRETLINNLNFCLHRGQLPQGTPISPYLTNILMVPIDYEISKALKDYERHNFVYTRYADDIEISCKQKFDPEEVINVINQIFTVQEVPFTLNTAKTKFVSTSGKNWSLGVMRNRDNEITVGHKNNQIIRARIFNFMYSPAPTPEEAQKLLGMLSYYKAVEPQYIKHILDKYSKKFNTSVERKLKNLIKNI